MLKERQAMENVLTKYGYGSTFPAKGILMSETNISRRTSGDRTGTDEMQRNYGIKALVLAQKNSIKQFYVYQLGESVNAQAPEIAVSGSDELALMGLFENLLRDAPGAQKATQLGQGFATTSKLLYGASYDAARTAGLALPSGVDGAAFNKNGTYSYVLWAKALTDNSEVASASYSFPAAWNLAGVQRAEWNFATTNATTTVPAQNLALTGAPLFFSEAPGAVVVAGVSLTSISPASAAVGASITLTGPNLTGATSVRFNGTTATSTFTSSSATQLVLTVPAGATSGPVTVTTPAGTSNGVAFTVVVPVVVPTPAPTTYSLTTPVAGSGTVSRSPSAATYASGTAVSLTATPAAGYQFGGWSGAATGATNPLQVTMTASKTITAIPVVVASTAPQVTSFTLINVDTQQPIRELLPGDVLNLATLPTQNLSIRANTSPATVGRVSFSLTGAVAKAADDTTLPYSLFGEAGGKYKAWTPTPKPGSYSLTATAYSAAGVAGAPLTRAFTVIKQVGAVAAAVMGVSQQALPPSPAAAVRAAAEAQPLRVFPNPSAEQATIEFALAEAQPYTLELFDGSGRVVARVAAGVAEAGRRYRYPVRGKLPTGLYVVRLVSGQAPQTLRLVRSN